MAQNELPPFETMLIAHLARIADALEKINRPGKDDTPDLVKPIEEFESFDWASIDAQVVKADRFGPSHVQWNGHIYTRRNPANKYGPAIWYSRSTGRDEENEKSTYARLITFREISDADPLNEKTSDVLEKNRRRAAVNTGTPAQPQGQPAGNGQKAHPVAYATYLTNAERCHISAVSADWLAKCCGVSDPAADFSKPNSLLEQVATLRQNGFDTQPKILAELRRLKLIG